MGEQRVSKGVEVMKKLAIMLAVLMVLGAVPGWCLLPTVDGYVDGHTKNSRFRPVQDTGEIYGTVNHEIGKGMDQVPLIKDRSVVVNPVNKLLGDSMDATKSLVNGTWDLLTFKSLRDKKK